MVLMIFTHALFLRNWDLGTKDLDLHTGDDGPFRQVWTTAYSLYLLASVGDYDADWYADSPGTRTLLVVFILAINIVMFESRDQNYIDVSQSHTSFRPCDTWENGARSI